MKHDLNDLPDGEQQLAAERHVQLLVLGSILVGGTPAALHASHRRSSDGAHVVLAALESAAGWQWDQTSRALHRSVDDWKPVVRDETLAFEPGTRWQYSNTGMLVAGAVIEKAAGVDYYE